MLASDLEAARRVKFLASGTPFDAQNEVWRSAGEADEKVARNKAMRTRANMVLSYVLATKNGRGRPGFIY